VYSRIIALDQKLRQHKANFQQGLQTGSYPSCRYKITINKQKRQTENTEQFTKSSERGQAMSHKASQIERQTIYYRSLHTA
jgi:hypothetical protein